MTEFIPPAAAPGSGVPLRCTAAGQNFGGSIERRRLRVAWLPDGKRLHLQDGPIDLVIQAFGRPREVARAYDAAIARMRGLLEELSAESGRLRAAGPAPQGSMARRMNAAVLPFNGQKFISPLAAAAGAVADEVLAAMCAAGRLERAFVNNSGDIALHLEPDQSIITEAVDRPEAPRLSGTLRIGGRDATRGIATSGWRGRSQSLGIADAVTVTARSAAAADAAATVIANAVDLPGHPAIIRVPAQMLNPESELGARLVTRHVGTLLPSERKLALAAGSAMADCFLRDGLITGAALYVQSEVELRCLGHTKPALQYAGL